MLKQKNISLLNSVLILGLVIGLTGCGSANTDPKILRLATTTSVDDSGLLNAILPDFESKYNVEVDVVAVGTGQALELGRRGDADVLLVHAPASEEEFVQDGYGIARTVIAYNDFVIVGPTDDPAGITNVTSAVDAFLAIMESKSTFASRGDDSGTHKKEKAIWEIAGVTPDPLSGWYLSVGQGMGATLKLANEEKAYVLTDRGTFLSQSENLPNLSILFGGANAAENPDPIMRNIYSVIPVNPDLHDNVDYELAQQFVDWISSVEVQAVIGEFGKDEFGFPLFYPDSDTWRAQSGIINPPHFVADSLAAG